MSDCDKRPAAGMPDPAEDVWAPCDEQRQRVVSDGNIVRELQTVPGVMKVALLECEELSSVASLLHHDLVVKTYLKPTDCAVCGKILLGVYHQGLWCRTCHIPLHKKCARSANESLVCDAASSSSTSPKTPPCAHREPLLDLTGLALENGDAHDEGLETLHGGDIGMSREGAASTPPALPFGRKLCGSLVSAAASVQRNAAQLDASLHERTTQADLALQERVEKLDKAVRRGVGRLDRALHQRVDQIVQVVRGHAQPLEGTADQEIEIWVAAKPEVGVRLPHHVERAT